MTLLQLCALLVGTKLHINAPVYSEGTLVELDFLVCIHLFYNTTLRDTCSLSYWGRHKIAANYLTTISTAFSWMKIFNFDYDVTEICFQGSNQQYIPALVQIMAWCRPGSEPLSELKMVSLLTHICVTWPQWVIISSRKRRMYYNPSLWKTRTCRSYTVNSLRPSDAYMRQ